MSKRRAVGDVVRKVPNAGFVGQSFVGRIADDGSVPCFLCDDPECKEWATLLSVDGLGAAYHVAECQMEDVETQEPSA